RFQDKSSREKALGRDAAGLEQVLKKLRAAAARAEAARRAAVAKAEREAREARQVANRTGQPAPARPAPTAPAAVAGGPQVGGAGWPLTGNLIAGYGANLPDGRTSQGLLIGASAGTAIRAVADGTVVYAEWMSGFGLI